jgi:hypothetical protein
MSPEAEIQSNNRKKRWLIYWVCVLASMVITVLEVAFYYHKEWDAYFYVLSSLAVIVGVSAWCYYDCRVRNGKLSQAMRGAIAFLGPFGVSAYFIESRGFRAALKVGFGLFLYVPFYALYFPTWGATVWILQALGFYN